MKLTLEFDTVEDLTSNPIRALNEIGKYRKMARFLVSQAYSVALQLAYKTESDTLDDPIVQSIEKELDALSAIDDEVKANSIKARKEREDEKELDNTLQNIKKDLKENPPEILKSDVKRVVIPEPVVAQELPPPPQEPKKEPVVLKRRGKYRDKICVDCKKVFTPNSGRTDRCPECREKHLEKLASEQHARQRERRHAASAAKKTGVIPLKKFSPDEEREIQKSVQGKVDDKPKIITCRRCHKPYIPAADDKNGYCPKCVEKIRNAPKLKPLNTLFTVKDVMAMPVLERYRYAYMWSYRERQEALAMKPLGALTPEEHEFFRRCESGDFMAD